MNPSQNEIPTLAVVPFQRFIFLLQKIHSLMPRCPWEGVESSGWPSRPRNTARGINRWGLGCCACGRMGLVPWQAPGRVGSGNCDGWRTKTNKAMRLDWSCRRAGLAMDVIGSRICGYDVTGSMMLKGCCLRENGKASAKIKASFKNYFLH